MNRWPPFCCVPAFFYNGLEKLHASIPGNQADMARLLGVRIPQGARNPFGLTEAAKEEDTGVSPQRASEVINTALSGTPFRFRHIQLKTIQMELYAEVAQLALDAGAVLGIGIDASAAPGGTKGYKHVLRLDSISGNNAHFFDDSGEISPGLVSWPTLEMSSLSIGDGFWVIGRKETLALPYCLPLESP